MGNRQICKFSKIRICQKITFKDLKALDALISILNFVLDNFEKHPSISASALALSLGAFLTYLYLTRNTFVVTFPMPHTHLWHKAKQSNGSINTQIIATLLVKNITNHPLGLSSARLIKPATKSNLIHSSLLIKSINTKYSG